MHTSYQLIIFDKDGHALVHKDVDKKTFTVGASDEADATAAAFGTTFFYIHRSGDRYVILCDDTQVGKSESISIKPGLIEKINGFQILICEAPAGRQQPSTEGNLVINGSVTLAIQKLMGLSQSSMSSVENIFPEGISAHTIRPSLSAQ